MSEIRQVERTVTAQLTSDGAGVALRRSIGSGLLPDLDPFLLLDAFGTDSPDDYIAGFPDHPHRGFETVTYMLAGRMRHRDNTGAEGVIGPGGVQWMTAGRGIVNSEMPEQQEGEMRGFQLWVNLPAADKMNEPRYQNIEPEAVPEIAVDTGAIVRLVAGAIDDTVGPVGGIAVEPLYADIELGPGGRFEQPVTPGHAAFVYPFAGSIEIAGQSVDAHVLAVLGDGDNVELTSENGGRAILVAGRPIGEPIVRYGPFVMNTRDEIHAAIRDFQTGNF